MPMLPLSRTAAAWLALVIAGAMVQPSAAQDRNLHLFALETRRDLSAAFEFEGAEQLDFETVELEGFVWNRSNETVEAFSTTEAFSAFRQAYVGFDPQNRDRGEIAVYKARLVPTKIGLAADYGRLLAAEWGPLNFGVEPYGPDVGEVVTGHGTEDGQRLSRLSVFRRGDALLVIRSTADEAEWRTFGAKVAAFVGSVSFDDADYADPVTAEFRPQGLDIPAAAGVEGSVSFRLPPHWERLGLENDDPRKGVFAFFADTALERGNGAAMLFSMDVPALGKGGPGDERMPEFAERLLELFMTNMLPGHAYEPERLGVMTFPELEPLVEFQGYFAIKVPVTDADETLGAHVLITRRGTQSVGFVVAAPSPQTALDRGENLSPTLVAGRMQSAIADYWRSAR